MINEGGGHGLPPAPTAAQALAAPGADAARPVVPSLPPSPPTRIRIPALGVDAPVTGLALDPDGHLEPPPPAEPNLAGWYRAGTTPGQRGTAVMAGHVDTRQGPAVFYRLGDLRRGDHLEVTRQDGSSAHFTVDAVETYRRSDFPDHTVYAAAPDAQLRLITCGGGYREPEGYDGNVVVFAHLVRAVRA
ncbi:class F sortase [Kitasatospora camelliae]|uniref:Class F sortase n=1 Tax=Kitasatospora camelliae TaxID=3156397 RepID=A0AAU8K6U9_9ACTN